MNCWEDHTRFKTLYRILNGVDNTFDIHRQSTPKDELLEWLRDYDGPLYVVILDEVDRSTNPDRNTVCIGNVAVFVLTIVIRQEIIP